MKVAHLVKNSCNPDWRVIKAAEAGVRKGYIVTIFAMWENGVNPVDSINGVNYVRIYPKFDFFSSPKERRYKQIPSFTEDFLANFLSLLSQITKFLRLTKHSSVRAPSMKRLERGFRKTSKSFVKDFSPDLIHCHDLETLRTGIELKDEINCKVIFDSHEFEQNKNPPADPLTNEYIRNQERKYITKADAVITVSEEIANNLRDIYKLSEKPTIIFNVPSTNLIDTGNDQSKVVTLIDDKCLYRLLDAAEHDFKDIDEDNLSQLIDDCLKSNYFGLAQKLKVLTSEGKNQMHLLDQTEELNEENSENFKSTNDDDSVFKNKYSTLERQVDIMNQQLNKLSNDGEIKFTLDKYEEKFIKRKLSKSILGIKTNKKSKIILRGHNRFQGSFEKEIAFKELPSLFNDFDAVGLHVGNLTVGRGIETAIRSLEMLPTHALALVGPRNNKSFLRKVHLLLDRFELGERVFFFDSLEENLCDFIGYFDYSLVTTLPVSKSTLYSMPNKLFESSIANVPIICSDTESASKFVLERKRGEIYNSGNEFALAAAIKKVTNNKEKYIYDESKQNKFIIEFSQSEQYKRMYKIYENLLNGK